MLEEYQELIKKTRLYLEQQLPKKAPTKALVFAPPAAKKVASEKKSSSPAPQQEAPLPPPPSPSLQATSPPLPTLTKLETIGSFTLEKNLPLIPQDLGAIKTTLQKLLPPELILFAFQNDELPFLEKIAQTLSDRALLSKAVLINERESLDTLFASTPAKIILTTFHPALTHKPLYHQLTPLTSRKRLLLLHPIPLYQSDVTLKQDLWNILKTLLPR
jgi:hypothetical protein